MQLDAPLARLLGRVADSLCRDAQDAINAALDEQGADDDTMTPAQAGALAVASVLGSLARALQSARVPHAVGPE